MNDLRVPKMILFDFSGTLAAEPDENGLQGAEALLSYCEKNPRNLGARDLFRLAVGLWQELSVPARRADREIHEFQSIRLRNELLGLEFSIPPQQQELVFWEAYTPLVPMPHMEELLGFLETRGIRKGVVSNIGFSGRTLAARLARTLPGHEFAFIIASSEYGVRKPDPLIFQLALAKANLAPEDIWFCGDNPRCDVEGAHAAGMFPVWYEELTVEDPRRDASAAVPACPHLHIHDWRELIEILKDLS